MYIFKAEKSITVFDKGLQTYIDLTCFCVTILTILIYTITT